MLLAVGVEHGYRVAISYADHAAEQGVGVGDTDQQCRQDKQRAENEQERPRVSGIYWLLAIV